MPANEQTIVLHRSAPAKPSMGQPCNGCGVCCAVETCPVARLLFLRVRGPCPALSWDGAQTRYLCGLLVAADRQLPWLPSWLSKPAGRWFARAIAAGHGCDSDLQAS